MDNAGVHTKQNEQAIEKVNTFPLPVSSHPPTSEQVTYLLWPFRELATRYAFPYYQKCQLLYKQLQTYSLQPCIFKVVHTNICVIHWQSGLDSIRIIFSARLGPPFAQSIPLCHVSIFLLSRTPLLLTAIFLSVCPTYLLPIRCRLLFQKPRLFERLFSHPIRED